MIDCPLSFALLKISFCRVEWMKSGVRFEVSRAVSKDVIWETGERLVGVDILISGGGRLLQSRGLPPLSR